MQEVTVTLSDSLCTLFGVINAFKVGDLCLGQAHCSFINSFGFVQVLPKQSWVTCETEQLKTAALQDSFYEHWVHPFKASCVAFETFTHGIRAWGRCSVSTQSPLHLVPSEKCHLKRFRGVHVLVGKCMSLAKCYLKRWIPRLIESEDVVGMGSTVTAVMLHLASWQKKWAKENHSPAEVVQMGFPHMENTHTHSSPVGSWESKKKMKVRFLFWITVFSSYYFSWIEEGLFGKATLLLSSISSSTVASRLSLSWISHVQGIGWAWGGAQLGSALLFAFAWVAACS